MRITLLCRGWISGVDGERRRYTSSIELCPVTVSVAMPGYFQEVRGIPIESASPALQAEITSKAQCPQVVQGIHYIEIDDNFEKEVAVFQKVSVREAENRAEHICNEIEQGQLKAAEKVRKREAFEHWLQVIGGKSIEGVVDGVRVRLTPFYEGLAIVSHTSVSSVPSRCFTKGEHIWFSSVKEAINFGFTPDVAT